MVYAPPITRVVYAPPIPKGGTGSTYPGWYREYIPRVVGGPYTQSGGRAIYPGGWVFPVIPGYSWVYARFMPVLCPFYAHYSRYSGLFLVIPEVYSQKKPLGNPHFLTKVLKVAERETPLCATFLTIGWPEGEEHSAQQPVT